METSRRRPPISSSSIYNAIDDGPAAVFDVDDDQRRKIKSFGGHAILLSFVLLASLMFLSSMLFPTTFSEIVHKAEDKVFLPARVKVAPTGAINLQVITQPLVAIPQGKSNDKKIPDTLNVVHDTSEPQSAVIVAKKIESNEVDLQRTVNDLIKRIRDMKGRGVVMEEDEDAKIVISELQDNLRKLLVSQYGSGPYYIEMKLKFPETMKDFDSAGADGCIVIEMAPIDLVPYSVYNFLEIVKNWKGGAFHRNAGHVLQSMVYRSKQQGLAFQEYHPEYPHERLTLGYAGRPGGPAFYISTVSNVGNHGPGSQGSRTEADSCFGKIYAGEDVVKRMQRQPGAAKGLGFVSGPENYIDIPSLQLMTAADVKLIKPDKRILEMPPVKQQPKKKQQKQNKKKQKM